MLAKRPRVQSTVEQPKPYISSAFTGSPPNFTSRHRFFVRVIRSYDTGKLSEDNSFARTVGPLCSNLHLLSRQSTLG